MRILCWLVLLAGSAVVSRAAPRNILLVIADDYGQDSSSLYNSHAGASLPPTPNIASLRTGGVLFRNAWAHPTCSPTRASILTGRQPFRTGVDQALPEITAVQVTGGLFSVTVREIPGTGYALWHSADMGNDSWAPLNNATSVAESGFVTLTDAAPAGSRSFYRVVSGVP